MTLLESKIELFAKQLIEVEKVVTEYLIKSQDREFQFQGELLAHQEATAELTNEAKCQIDAKTYSIDNGGYVSAVEFLISNQPDAPIVLFEEIDLMEDVEKFYYVFEPAEIFDQKSASVEEREQAVQNCKKLSLVYEKMIFALLDQFQSQCECRGLKDKPKPAKSKGSLWSKLGIK